MRSINQYSIYILSLLVVEFSLCIIFFKLEGLILFEAYSWSIKRATSHAWDINTLRAVFYFPIYIVAFIYLLKRPHKKNRIWQIAIINCGLYVFISLLYGFILIPGTKEYFVRDFFYFFIIATFTSPFILNTIPYYKRLVKEL